MNEDRYVRTQGGAVVHRSGCTFATKAGAVEWRWADGKTLDQLDRELREAGLGYRACLRCMTGLPTGVFLGAR